MDILGKKICTRLKGKKATEEKFMADAEQLQKQLMGKQCAPVHLGLSCHLISLLGKLLMP